MLKLLVKEYLKKVRNKIADKITSKPIKNDVTNERYVSPEERQKILDELRLA